MQKCLEYRSRLQELLAAYSYHATQKIYPLERTTSSVNLFIQLCIYVIGIVLYLYLLPVTLVRSFFSEISLETDYYSFFQDDLFKRIVIRLKFIAFNDLTITVVSAVTKRLASCAVCRMDDPRAVSPLLYLGFWSGCVRMGLVCL